MKEIARNYKAGMPSLENQLDFYERLKDIGSKAFNLPTALLGKANRYLAEIHPELAYESMEDNFLRRAGIGSNSSLEESVMDYRPEPTAQASSNRIIRALKAGAKAPVNGARLDIDQTYSALKELYAARDEGTIDSVSAQKIINSNTHSYASKKAAERLAEQEFGLDLSTRTQLTDAYSREGIKGVAKAAASNTKNTLLKSDTALLGGLVLGGAAGYALTRAGTQAAIAAGMDIGKENIQAGIAKAAEYLSDNGLLAAVGAGALLKSEKTRNLIKEAGYAARWATGATAAIGAFAALDMIDPDIAVSQELILSQEPIGSISDYDLGDNSPEMLTNGMTREEADIQLEDIRTLIAQDHSETDLIAKAEVPLAGLTQTEIDDQQIEAYKASNSIVESGTVADDLAKVKELIDSNQEVLNKYAYNYTVPVVDILEGITESPSTGTIGMDYVTLKESFPEVKIFTPINIPFYDPETASIFGCSINDITYDAGDGIRRFTSIENGIGGSDKLNFYHGSDGTIDSLETRITQANIAHNDRIVIGFTDSETGKYTSASFNIDDYADNDGKVKLDFSGTEGFEDFDASDRWQFMLKDNNGTADIGDDIMRASTTSDTVGNGAVYHMAPGREAIQLDALEPHAEPIPKTAPASQMFDETPSVTGTTTTSIDYNPWYDIESCLDELRGGVPREDYSILKGIDLEARTQETLVNMGNIGSGTITRFDVYGMMDDTVKTMDFGSLNDPFAYDNFIDSCIGDKLESLGLDGHSLAQNMEDERFNFTGETATPYDNMIVNLKNLQIDGIAAADDGSGLAVKDDYEYDKMAQEAVEAEENKPKENHFMNPVGGINWTEDEMMYRM